MENYQNQVKITKWFPEHIFKISQRHEPYACILLNRPIIFEPVDFLQLWNNAAIRVLVDGGANRWFTYIDENGLADQIKSPCYLTGDMDSITEASIKRLDALKYQKILTPDQDATDCTKSVIAIEPFLQPNNIETVFLLTDFGGRIDHTMSQIGTLFKLLKIVPQANVYLMGNATLAWLLCPGKHEMEIPKELVEEEIWCSYIPINGPTCVTTEGLKWDLAKEITSFGGILSTSNTYKSTLLQIECDNYLFWSMGTERE